MEELIEEASRKAEVPGYDVSDTANAVLEGKTNFTFAGVADGVLSVFTKQLRENGITILRITAIGILSGVVAALCSDKNEIGTLACVAVVSLVSLKTFSYFIITAKETIDSMLLFMQALMPSVATATAVVGQTAQAAVCGTVFGAMQVFIYICKELFLPLVAVMTALGVANHLGNASYLKSMLGGLGAFYKWGTGLLLTLYSVVIGLQAQSAGIFDTTAGKAVRYAVGSFVPLVGGALSDSLDMIGTGAKTIKAALGVSGIIGIFYVCMQPLIHICAVALGYKIAACLCAVLAENKVAGVIHSMSGNLVRICGILLVVCVMFIISIAMLCRFGGVL